MEQTTLSALLRRSRSAAKAVAIPLLAAGAAATAVFVPQAASALTVGSYSCVFDPFAPPGNCVPTQLGDKLVTFKDFFYTSGAEKAVPVTVDYTWFDFEDDSQGPAPFRYEDDKWELTVRATNLNLPFAGPFNLTYSYDVEIIPGPGLDDNGVAFNGTSWYFDQFGIGQNAIGNRTTTFKTVTDPESGASLTITCDTTNTGTVCTGLTDLLASAKKVTITDNIVVTATNALVTSVSNSWTQKKQSVPGPLPILGAGVAFATSRRIRRRISTAKSA